MVSETTAFVGRFRDAPELQDRFLSLCRQQSDTGSELRERSHAG